MRQVEAQQNPPPRWTGVPEACIAPPTKAPADLKSRQGPSFPKQGLFQLSEVPTGWFVSYGTP